jgi:uncharacterized repeat protein (TIGR01451 family)
MNSSLIPLRVSIASWRSSAASCFALATVALVLCTTSGAFAGANVTIDGHLQDMIDYAGTISTPANGCAFVDEDPAKDIRIFDPKIVPCAPITDNYYVNGFDQTLDVLAYDRNQKTLFLGVRVAGIIGDPDGNGDPNIQCAQATFEDEVGIGFNDAYTWEINTDCAGAPEIVIELRDNTLTVTGATTGTKTYAFDGSELEVAIENITLPPAYAVRVFTGNIVDGLGEDLHQLFCAPSGPQITVDKTANPERICPEANTTFTIVVTNPGGVPLQTVNLTDDIPAGLSFVAGSSNSNCGVGQPNLNGQQLTWPAFTLEAGASCTITFQAKAGAQCSGPQNNVATAVGSFSTACFNNGEPQTVQDSDDATVTCAPPPCVNITAVNGPESACANGAVTISGTVQNCGQDAETISVTLNGGAPQNLGSVAAGASANFTFQTTVGQCTPGQNVPFAVVATATNDCGEATDTETRNVLCKAPPCVNITTVNAPAEACANTAVMISGTVQNCGTDAETISVTLNGGAPVNLGSVAGGASANFSFESTMGACTVGQNVAFAVVATATNDCGEATDTETRNVLCKAGPCVNITDVTGPGSACANASITISGSVQNCGTDAETITVTLNGGAPQNLGSVAAGASANFSFQTTMGACTAGQNVAFSVVATATNDCGEATDTETENVLCKAPPCVNITVVNAPTSACANASVTISGTVQNCGPDSETIVVVLNGGASQNLGPVAAGASANFSFQTTMGNCSAGQNVAFTVVATATNDCGEATDTETRNVSCGIGPCVQVSLDAPDDACVGEQIEVTASVTNCSTAAENISVTVNGQSHNFGSIPAGGNASHALTFTVQNCVDGGVNYSATATASNECGEITAQDSERVICETPHIDVEKTAESSVANGATIHYVITVTNPGPTALDNVVVTDELCPYVRYADSASPNPSSEPAVGSGGTVEWHIASLAVNQTVQLSFNATADVLFGGGTCPAEVTCDNHVVATGFCAGTGTSGTPARDEDTFPTTIICTADNCPRTVGYWGAQCAQRDNGSTKYSVEQLTQIAQCIDDRMSFFNWSSGTDFDRFCGILNPSKPMTSKKQALRQLVGTLANLCVDELDIDPRQGGVVKLDPNTPISCDGFEANTIGELIDEVDDILAQLEGGGSSSATYNQIISCFDGINNGTNIPTNCDDSNDSELGNDFGSSGVWTAETLGRAAPNPFASSMRFSYEVPAGEAQVVEVGIYNVAGRLVTRLTSEVQGSGVYTVDWNGRDASGVQMAPGVYFLKSRIGSQETVSRLLKVAQ